MRYGIHFCGLKVLLVLKKIMFKVTLKCKV